MTLASVLNWCDAASRAGNTETNNSTIQGGTSPAGSTDAPSAVTCLARRVSPELMSKAQNWVERLKSLVTEVNDITSLVGDCEQRHFGGQSALFPDVAIRLQLLVGFTRRFLDLSNAACSLNLFPFSCYIDRADLCKVSDRFLKLVERAEEKVRLAKRPSWSRARRTIV